MPDTMRRIMSGVGYVYDPLYLEHELPGHPERPDRLSAIMSHLEDSGLLGSGAVVVSSASSKTASALAFLLSRRGQGEVIGLTSPRSTDFASTTTPFPSRWRDSSFRTVPNMAGGSGTPGPRLPCGLPRLYNSTIKHPW